MNNPGIYNLGDLAVTASLTDQVITEGVSEGGASQSLIDRLQGMAAASIQCKFAYGSGGTSCAVIVQTSLDQGATWIDIARFEFTTASSTKAANLSAAAVAAIAAVTALSTETKLDGILGDRLRAKVTSVGIYANTTVSVRAATR